MPLFFQWRSLALKSGLSWDSAKPNSPYEPFWSPYIFFKVSFLARFLSYTLHFVLPNSPSSFFITLTQVRNTIQFLYFRNHVFDTIVNWLIHVGANLFKMADVGVAAIISYAKRENADLSLVKRNIKSPKNTRLFPVVQFTIQMFL